MYSIHEKLVELCPIIKELLVDEGVIRTIGGGGGQLGGGGGPGGPKAAEQTEQNNVVMNEMLARLVNLQQFIQGGHGSQSRSYQP